MNKEEFNQLSILDQMKYINDLLDTNISLTKACDTIGINRATVRKRFKAKEIVLDKELNKYVFEIPVEKYGVEAMNKKYPSTTDKVIPLETKVKPVKKVDNLDSIKLLEEKIKTLESQIEATNKRIDTITTTKTTVNTTTDTTINTYEGDEVVRSFRLNEGVQQRFKTYCKAHSNSKVSDILSTVIDEYLKSQGY